jgi:hypothetical protein
VVASSIHLQIIDFSYTTHTWQKSYPHCTGRGWTRLNEVERGWTRLNEAERGWTHSVTLQADKQLGSICLRFGKARELLQVIAACPSYAPMSNKIGSEMVLPSFCLGSYVGASGAHVYKYLLVYIEAQRQLSSASK